MRQALGADCLYAARVELICPSQSSYSELTFANANVVQQLLLSGMLVLPQNNNVSEPKSRRGDRQMTKHKYTKLIPSDRCWAGIVWESRPWLSADVRWL